VIAQSGGESEQHGHPGSEPDESGADHPPLHHDGNRAGDTGGPGGQHHGGREVHTPTLPATRDRLRPPDFGGVGCVLPGATDDVSTLPDRPTQAPPCPSAVHVADDPEDPE